MKSERKNGKEEKKKTAAAKCRGWEEGGWGGGVWARTGVLALGSNLPKAFQM